MRFVKVVTFGHAHTELVCVETSWELQSLPQSDAPFVIGGKMLQISWKCIVCVGGCVLFLFRKYRYGYPLVFQEVQAPRIFLDSRQMKVASLSALRTVRFCVPLPQDIFLVLMCVRGSVDPRAIVRPEGLMSLPLTPSGIETATVQLVGQSLIQLRHRVRLVHIVPTSNFVKKVFIFKWKTIVKFLGPANLMLVSEQWLSSPTPPPTKLLRPN
jgi:hypothetical protein